ncbi:MAG: CAP domain-containing protein [Acidimicrobiia bacterium]|nr:CAP domain-containing protein [Acidimicrobiia bacterium]
MTRMLVSRTGWCRVIAAVAVVAGLLVSISANSGASAQTAGGNPPTGEDIEVRDNLIADQESLLSIYRCLLGVDTQLVLGGCANGQPVLGRTLPGVFSGTPTHQDIAVRDNLIADQESLLNTYRCQFDIDTQIVPGRCRTSPTQTDLADLETQAEIIGAEAEMAQMVSELRHSLGLAPLSYSIDLANVARNWSQTMRDTGQFVHNPNYLQQYPPGATLARENIATVSGTTLAEAVQIAFDGLVASPGHYATITSTDVNHFGIGIAIEGSSFWFTQNFAYYP